MHDLTLLGNAAPEASDQRLLEGLCAHQESAYEELLERFEHPVYNLVYRLLNDPNETADIVQEVFLKVFRKIDTFRGECTLKTWIYRIAVHEAYNRRRWFKRHRQQETALESADDLAAINYVDVLPDPGRSPFQVTLDHQTRERIEEALTHLKPVYRTAVVLRDIEELSYEEIATILDTNLGTVKSRIVRGREALREALTSDRERTPALAWAPQTVAGGNS